MIDIPLGMCLVPVEHIGCIGCIFRGDLKCPRWEEENDGENFLPCGANGRKDGRGVIFKLEKFPVKEKV